MPIVEARLFLVFLLVFIRVGGLMMTVPVLGPQQAPVRIRLMIALCLSLFVTVMHCDVQTPWPGNLLNLTIAAAKELMIGLSLGLAVLMVAAGVQLAGHVMAEVGGFRLGDTANPTTTDGMSAHAQLLYLTALAVFVVIGGHRQVMAALLDTFQWMPPGQARFSTSLLDAIVETSSQCFSLAVRASAPVAAALLMATLLVGLISRTVQQLNTFGIGLTVNAMVILVIMAVTVGGSMWAFREELETALASVRSAMALSVESANR